jgi:hypothetical protein
MVPIVTIVAVSVIIASGGADPPHNLQPLRITVAAPASVDRGFVQDMVAEASAIWRTAGLTIVARHWPAGGDGVPSTEITVTLHDGHSESPDGSATLGWITFVGPNAPQPAIHLSRGNALELMGRTASIHDVPKAWQEFLLARALGRALAHELGHYLLKSAAHEARGLMRAERPSIDFFTPSRTGFELTGDQRARLADRVLCAQAETMR